MHKISVIVPIYDTGKYLTRCLQSIVDQSYQNIEIILVNDGSTDNSLAVCNQFARKDSRIRIINQANAGVSAARNVGLESSNGDLIAFIDSDDFIDRKYLNHLVDEMDACKSDIAIMSYLAIHSDGKYFVPDDPHGNGKKYDGVYTPEQWLRSGLIGTNIIDVVPWGKLFKKTIFDNIKFPIHQKFCEDEMTIWKTILQADRISFYNIKEYMYDYHDKSLTRVSSILQRYIVKLKAWEERITLMTMLNMDTSYMKDGYILLLKQVTEESLKNGDMMNYHQAVTKMKIIQNLA